MKKDDEIRKAFEAHYTKEAIEHTRNGDSYDGVIGELYDWFVYGARECQPEIKDRRPPIKKTCPECGGTMEIVNPCIGMIETDLPPVIDCDNCINGEVYNYLTPEQWEAETGEKMLNSDPVWSQLYNYADWILCEYSQAIRLHGRKIIVARPGQPKPDDNWRPE